ncbi:class I SAM-dependent methyltransferase [Streptomyces jeddahensis]|uniref:Methyltransferase domain protein n=1 Tax=Streptomyces jeddahensis TaxID=1716141 RepID=A0A177HVA1_9ACTN|nr:methyltransferase domain protein [Streptomyces jeddahensis]
MSTGARHTVEQRTRGTAAHQGEHHGEHHGKHHGEHHGEQLEAAAPWSGGDPYSDALRAGRGPLFLRRADGWLLPLDVERWCARADPADLSALRRCEGSVLDIGCGPGRLVAALAARGHPALGIDVSEAAVAHTLRLGGRALCRSIFDPLPDEGSWGTALLIDGNIGIGGDPGALLDRVAQVLSPGGLLIAEAAPVDVDERVEVRVDDGHGAMGGLFPWARLGSQALLRCARRLGWRPTAQWSAGGRPFVALRAHSGPGTVPRQRAVPRPRAVRHIRVTSQRAEIANSAAETISQRDRNTSAESPVPSA